VVATDNTEVSAMYARIGRTEDGTTGATEVCVLHRLAGADDLVLSLWPTEAQAAADPAAECYEVEDDEPGGGRDARSAFAGLTWFDGPMSAPVRDAARRAGRERIGPVLAGHAGTVRSMVLWQRELRRMLVVTLAVSVDALEDGQRTVLSTELLPGEDPALLPGPDRVDVFRVVSMAGVR
jgi:hypothetical protein